jgi:hypothetical protein
LTNEANLLANFVSFHLIKIRSPKRYCVEEVSPQQLLQEQETCAQIHLKRSCAARQAQQMQLQITWPVNETGGLV